MIDIYAGKTAYKTLQEEGFQQSLFTSFLGASGGPKWFILYALDKYLFGQFFKGRTQPLQLIGSSAGAFRAACLAQKDPVAAIERLAVTYAETVYSDNAKPDEITRKAREILDTVFGEHGAQEVINNPIFKAHFVVAKANGLAASENKILQGAGLLTSYVRNRINRKLLTSQYERFIYQTPTSTLSINDPYKFKTHHVVLNQSNIKEALLASGSIPMVMEGIKNIGDSPEGTYRDGGIIDYHFDFKIENKGLILYPHFNSQPKAGWFDKNLSRKVSTEHYNNIVLICPSKAFVNALPYQKIPDRNDFTTMDANTRIAYWKTVMAKTEDLALELASVINDSKVNLIQKLP